MSPESETPVWNYESLYARYHRLVFNRALALLRRPDTAMDATQEVFLRLLHGDGEILHLVDPSAWLSRVTTNLCLNKLRDQQRRKRILFQNKDSAAVSATADAEHRTIVRDLLDQVAPVLREVAVLHYLNEMTQDEIAERLGVSRRTVCNRLVDLHERVIRADTKSTPVWRPRMAA